MLFNKNCFLLFITLIFLTDLVPAQCNSISGVVLDKETKEPLEFATVYIEELQRGALSDEKGAFIIENICDGIYSFIVSHVGCNKEIYEVNISKNRKFDFFLPHSINELKQITISEKMHEDESIVPIQILGEKEIDATRGKSLGQALQQINGVRSIETGNTISKPVIHGMHSNRVLLMNNGVRQESQQWGSEHAPEIDPFIANQLTVIKGASAVRYGADAIGGVVLVEPKELRDSAGVSGEIHLVGFSNNRQGVISAMVEQNFNKIPSLSWRLQGTMQQAGNTKTPLYWLKNTGLKEYNFSYAIGWKKEKYGIELFYSQFNTTLGIFSGSHIGNLTDLQAAFNRSQPMEKSDFSYRIDRPYQQVEHELLKAKIFFITALGKINFIYARQYNLRNEYDKHPPLNDQLAALNRPELHYEITTHNAELLLEHKKVRFFSGMLGLTAQTQANTYEGRFFIPNYKNYSGGLFLIERIRKRKTDIELGLRYDYKWLKSYFYDGSNALVSPELSFQNISGSIGCIYHLSSAIKATANISSAWRAPTVNELYSNGLHHGAAAIEIGNKNLVSEKAYHFSSSIQYSHKENLQLEADAYFYYINNFIYLKPTLSPTLTIRGAFPTFKYTQVDATFRGVDVKMNYRFNNHLLIFSKTSLLLVNNITDRTYLILMPPNRFENGLKWTIKEYKRVKDLEFNVSNVIVGRQWRVPYNSDFATPPNAYSLLNIDMSCSFHHFVFPIHIGIGVNNVLNTVYRDYMNRFRYYSDAVGRNISIRIKFIINKPKNKKS